MKRFDYTGWALSVSAQCLKNDLDCGFAIADEDTPDGEKARKAMERLILRLKREAEKRSHPTVTLP